MKKLNSSKPSRKLLLTSVCVTSLTMSACSALSPKPDTLSDENICNKLQELVADHPNQFNKTKKNFTPTRRGNIWSTEKLFPTADTCQVWEWSTGLFNYVCDWKKGNDEDQAVKNYHYGNDVIQSCLGDTWTAHTNTTQSGGERTYYDTPGKDTIVTIRYFKNKRGLTSSWQNSVVIGDKSNLKAPTN